MWRDAVACPTLNVNWLNNSQADRFKTISYKYLHSCWYVLLKISVDSNTSKKQTGSDVDLWPEKSWSLSIFYKNMEIFFGFLLLSPGNAQQFRTHKDNCLTGRIYFKTFWSDHKNLIKAIRITSFPSCFHFCEWIVRTSLSSVKSFVVSNSNLKTRKSITEPSFRILYGWFSAFTSTSSCQYCFLKEVLTCTKQGN